MTLSTKAQEVAIQLRENIIQRLTGLVNPPFLPAGITYDTDGGALIKVGSGVTATPGILYKVIPYAWPLPTNAIGQTQPVYTPTTILMCYEAGAGGANDSYNTPGLDLVFKYVAKEFNTRVELYISPNGTPPSPTQFISANFIGAFDNLYYPLQLTT